MNRHLVTAVTVAGLTLPMLVGLSGTATPTAKRHVTRAISSITVKVVSAEDYARKAKGADPTVTREGKPAPWIITSHDADSCVAWVSSQTRTLGVAEVEAFKACRAVLSAAR